MAHKGSKRESHPLYHTWNGMKGRCCRVGHHKYKNYGARGISICDRWRYSFDNFISDMGPKPSPKHSIERINNDGNYEPSNCKWATYSEQCRNFRQNKMLPIDGVMLCMTDFCKELKINSNALYYHLSKGKSIDEVIIYFRNKNAA